MNIEDFIMGIIYIVALGCVLYYIIKHQIDKLKRDSKPINKVHFYVARDKNGDLWLYISKPIREDYFFQSSDNGFVAVNSKLFYKIGLNEKDYDYIKWEDEPVEVFLNLED